MAGTVAAGTAALSKSAFAAPVLQSPDDTEQGAGKKQFRLKGAVITQTYTVTTQKAKPEATLKLSCQVWLIPGRDLPEKLATMEKWGFDGVELGGDIVGNEKKFQDALKNTKLKVSAICGAKGTADGRFVSEVVANRAPALGDIKAALTSAGALGSTGVIYVPAFNGQTKLGNYEIRKLLLDTLPALGEHATKAGTRLILEPLNRKEAFFLRQVADAASIVRDCNNPGLAVMGDFYHMFIEETSDLGAFISGGSYVHHVHLASRIRVLPGQDERQFVNGFRGLKLIGYQDYCSFECSVKGNAVEEIPKSMAFLREQWAKA
jgi:sugar phosphate isomerase/epimerase